MSLKRILDRQHELLEGNPAWGTGGWPMKEEPSQEYIGDTPLNNMAVGPRAGKSVSSSTKGVKHDSTKLPYYKVLFTQFPLALEAVVKASKAGHEKYKETDLDWQNFSRVENASTRYKDAGLRHLTEKGQVTDMVDYGEITHEAAVVWNFLADLEINLRKQKDGMV